MPRRIRFAPPGYYLHITQRGNYRQRTFFAPSDHELFTGLIADYAPIRRVEILGYCIMSNHYHLVARTHIQDGISMFLRDVNSLYARHLHARLGRRGRLWQDRFYGCVLDQEYVLPAVRYVELNPVRAGIRASADDHPWSSARAHTGRATTAPDWLDLASFHNLTTPERWRSELAIGQSPQERSLLRSATRAEQPLGPPEFTSMLEAASASACSASRAHRPASRQSGSRPALRHTIAPASYPFFSASTSAGTTSNRSPTIP